MFWCTPTHRVVRLKVHCAMPMLCCIMLNNHIMMYLLDVYSEIWMYIDELLQLISIISVLPHQDLWILAMPHDVKLATCKWPRPHENRWKHLPSRAEQFFKGCFTQWKNHLDTVLISLKAFWRVWQVMDFFANSFSKLKQLSLGLLDVLKDGGLVTCSVKSVNWNRQIQPIQAIALLGVVVSCCVGLLFGLLATLKMTSHQLSLWIKQVGISWHFLDKWKLEFLLVFFLKIPTPLRCVSKVATVDSQPHKHLWSSITWEARTWSKPLIVNSGHWGKPMVSGFGSSGKLLMRRKHATTVSLEYGNYGGQRNECKDMQGGISWYLQLFNFYLFQHHWLDPKATVTPLTMLRQIPFHPGLPPSFSPPVRLGCAQGSFGVRTASMCWQLQS